MESRVGEQVEHDEDGELDRGVRTIEGCDVSECVGFGPNSQTGAPFYILLTVNQ